MQWSYLFQICCDFYVRFWLDRLTEIFLLFDTFQQAAALSSSSTHLKITFVQLYCGPTQAFLPSILSYVKPFKCALNENRAPSISQKVENDSCLLLLNVRCVCKTSSNKASTSSVPCIVMAAPQIFLFFSAVIPVHGNVSMLCKMTNYILDIQ